MYLKGNFDISLAPQAYYPLRYTVYPFSIKKKIMFSYILGLL